MADSNYIGIAMGLDVSDLKAGLSEANKQIQLANSEFKAASSGMEDFTKSTEGLTAKVKQLDTILKMQKSKLAGLQAEYQKVANEQGESSEAARRLKVQINNQQAVVNKTEREFNNYTKTLQEAEDGLIDLEQVALRNGKVIKNLGDDADEAGDGFTVLKGSIATFIGNGLTKLVEWGKEAITTVYGLADATREYRKTLATLDAGATDVGVSTEYIRDKFADLMGVLQDDAGVTEGLNNLLTAGFDEKTLDDITKNLEGAALKWKDTLKFEGLSDSLQEWIGSDGANLTGNFAELLERMGYNLEDVQKKTKGMTDEQRRNYAVNLLAKEGLAEVSDKYREQNADMIEAQKANVEYQNSVARMGEVVEPITTRIREGLTLILNKLLEMTEGVDLEALGTKITGAFQTFVDEVIPKIVEGFGWIIDNKDILIAGIAGIGVAMATMNVANMILGVVKAFQAFKKAQEGATIAQWLLNVAMNANPIGIIIALIAGLVTAFVVLWNKSEGFRNFWIGLWDSIKNACSKAWDYISGVFDDLGEWFSGIAEDFTDAGANIISGIWDGIKNGKKWLKDKITGFAGNVADWFKDTFQINSPSRLMEKEVGVYVGQGVIPTSASALGQVKKRLSKFSDFVTDNLGGIKSNLDIGTSSVGNHAMRGNTVVNAGMTVHYNGNLSRKQLRQIENDNYTSLKMRLKAEGVI
jgi:phage-related protein